MDKRYQVFLSSTYEDLKEERQEVIKALLELDCFPSGMEYFPAANDEQWTYIKDLIDQCDYYIVIVGGRYGSKDESGISYTQKEYEYAISKDIPVIAFVHSDPDSIPSRKTESNVDSKNKLSEFNHLVRQRLCKDWSNLHELGAVVSRSLTQLIKRNPRSGWIRAENLTSEESSKEIIRLYNIVESQKKELDSLKLKSPESAQNLANGDETFEVTFNVTLSNRSLGFHNSRRHAKYQLTKRHSWNEIFISFAPYFTVSTKESTIKSGISRMLKDLHSEELTTKQEDYEIASVSPVESCLRIIIIQFEALGYIEINLDNRDEKPKRMVKLTPLGHQHLLNISAIKSTNAALPIN